MNELNLCAAFFFETLRGDAQIVAAVGTYGVYEETVDQGTAFPYILVRLHPSHRQNDSTGMSGARSLTRPLWIVEAVDNSNDLSVVGPIGDRIDALLHNARRVTADAALTCLRAYPVQHSETPASGGRYNHSGGAYRVTVAPVAI